MNAAYGQWGYGIDVSDIVFESPMSIPGAPTSGKGTSGRQGTSAEDWAKLGLGVGAATGGIGQLVASLKGGGVVVQPAAAAPLPAAAAPSNTGLMILGVGAVAMLGLLGLAVASKPASGR